MLTDCFAKADMCDAFHAYRLIIRGDDMTVALNEKCIIDGSRCTFAPGTVATQAYLL